jgi:hypothetical protein
MVRIMMQPTRQRYRKTCACGCGRRFRSTKPHALYASRACRMAAYRARRQEREPDWRSNPRPSAMQARRLGVLATIRARYAREQARDPSGFYGEQYAAAVLDAAEARRLGIDPLATQ